MPISVFTIAERENLHCTKNENYSLVCRTLKEDQIVVFWGSLPDRMRNINLIQNKKKIPFRVKCDCIEPPDWAKAKYKHNWWIPETSQIKLLT
jgi:hypothetical protein